MRLPLSSFATSLLLALSLSASPATQVPHPDRALLLDAAAAGPHLFAVGAHGVILTSDDDGLQWRQQPSPVSTTLTCISFADTHRGWIGGHHGVLLLTRDAGASWQPSAAPTTPEDSLLDVLATPDGSVLAIGAYGLLLRSRDAGTSWQRLSAPSDDLHLNRISLAPSGTLLLAGEAGTLALSHDFAETWQLLATPYAGSFFGLLSLHDGQLLAHGLRGHVFLGSAEGAHWSPSPLPGSGLLATAVELAPGKVIAAGNSSQLYLSRDGGRSFAQGPSSELQAVSEILVSPRGSLILVGDTGVRRLAPPSP